MQRLMRILALVAVLALVAAACGGTSEEGEEGEEEHGTAIELKAPTATITVDGDERQDRDEGEYPCEFPHQNPPIRIVDTRNLAGGGRGS